MKYLNTYVIVVIFLVSTVSCRAKDMPNFQQPITNQITTSKISHPNMTTSIKFQNKFKNLDFSKSFNTKSFNNKSFNTKSFNTKSFGQWGIRSNKFIFPRHKVLCCVSF